MDKPILVLGLSPGFQRTISLSSFETGRINRAHTYREDVSGKPVNVARVINQLEQGAAQLILPLGAENQEAFTAELDKDQIAHIAISVPGYSRWCYTILDERGLEGAFPRMTELIVEEPELPAEALDEAGQKILKSLEGQLPASSGLIITGSRPAGWQSNLYAQCISLAKAAGKPCLADFRGPELLLAIKTAVPEIIKINEDEFVKTFGPISERSEPVLFKTIVRQSQLLNNTIIITRGSRPTLAAVNGMPFRLENRPLVPVNEIGCGDAFSAGLMYAWVRGESFINCLELAGDCAAKSLGILRPGSIE
jgi:1-phosphofructokinase